jgi:phosphoglycolate phosphatase-like HAD superfamily hydrolase
MRSENTPIKVISFDFDGVFVRDSEAVFKKAAWSVAFASYIGIRRYEPFLKEGNALFGSGKPGGRKEIMQYVFEKLGEPAESIKDLVEKSAKAFDDYVQRKIMEAGLVPGSREMLEDLSGRGILMYLNSGTATSALITSAKNLQISDFFRQIFGSTEEPFGGSKVVNLHVMGRWEKVRRKEILFVGDGESDIKAAREFGCSFLGFSNRWNNWEAEKKPFPVITDLRDVAKYL